MSPAAREILLWIGIAVILAIVIFATDRQQPDSMPKDDPDEPQVLEEDELDQ